MKTLAIRLEDDIHAQLTMLAQLEGLTVTDAIRQAIASFVEAKRSNPELSAKAEAVLADIDRDAASRRDAIASLFESEQPKAQRSAPKATTDAGEKTLPRPGRAKGGTPAS
jgi:predicted transcriptional regulator